MRHRSAAVLLIVAASLAWAAGGPAEGLAALRQRCQEVRLQLSTERARVLRDDPQAVALREQIEKLYRELDRVVSEKPAVVRLQADLARLEETLKAQDPSAGTPLLPGEVKP